MDSEALSPLGQISKSRDNVPFFIQVTDESGTYIIEPVSGEEYYSEDPNIMWIQETVEVEQESYDNLPNMVRL
jgi:hypothetical protein